MNQLHLQLNWAGLLLGGILQCAQGAMHRAKGASSLQALIGTGLSDKPEVNWEVCKIDSPTNWLRLGVAEPDLWPEFPASSSKFDRFQSDRFARPDTMEIVEVKSTERPTVAHHSWEPDNVPGPSKSSSCREYESRSGTNFCNVEKLKSDVLAPEQLGPSVKQWQKTPNMVLYSEKTTGERIAEVSLLRHTTQSQIASSSRGLKRNFGEATDLSGSSRNSQGNFLPNGIEFRLALGFKPNQKAASNWDHEADNHIPFPALPEGLKLSNDIEPKENFKMSHGGKESQAIIKKMNPNEWDFLKLNSKKNEEGKRIDEAMLKRLFKNGSQNQIRTSFIISKDKKAGNYILCDFVDGPYPLESSSAATRFEQTIDITLGVFDENFSNVIYSDMIEEMKGALTQKILMSQSAVQKSNFFSRKLFRIQELVMNVTKFVTVKIFFALNLVKEYNPNYETIKEFQNIMIFFKSFWKDICEDRFDFDPKDNPDFATIAEIVTYGQDFQENYHKYQRFAFTRRGLYQKSWCIFHHWWEINSPRIFGDQKRIVIERSGFIRIYNRLIIYANYSLVMKKFKGMSKNPLESEALKWNEKNKNCTK